MSHGELGSTQSTFAVLVQFVFVFLFSATIRVYLCYPWFHKRFVCCVSFAAVHIPCNCRVIVGAIIGSKLDKRVIVRALEICQLSGFLGGSNFASQARRNQTLSVLRYALVAVE